MAVSSRRGIRRNRTAAPPSSSKDNEQPALRCQSETLEQTWQTPSRPRRRRGAMTRASRVDSRRSSEPSSNPAEQASNRFLTIRVASGIPRPHLFPVNWRGLISMPIRSAGLCHGLGNWSSQTRPVKRTGIRRASRIYGMKNVLTLVLGGGQGTRLYPLTKYRSKPAVPVAGKYRLIDIPLVELHQQRAEPLLRADAVQFGQPAPPHPLDLHLRSLRRRLRRGAGRPANARQRRLVSGHGRRRAAEPPLRRAARHRVRADPLRRPTLPDELPGHARSRTSRPPPT